MAVHRAIKITVIVLSAGAIVGIAVYLLDPFPSQSIALSASAQLTNHEPEQGRAFELVFPEPLADLGNRKGVVEHHFHYRNQSTQPVVIEAIQPSCACAVIRPDRTQLEPGEEGSFGIKVDLNNSPRGFKRFVVEVRYEGSTSRRATLELGLMNDPDIYVTEQPVSLTGVAGDTLSSRFALVDYREEPIKTLLLRAKGVFRTQVVQRPDTYQPGWKWVLEVSANTANIQPGRYQETLMVEAEPALPHPIAVSVDMRLLPRVYLRPPMLALSKDDVFGDNKGQIVDFHDHRGDGSAIEIESVACSSETVAWTIVAADNGSGPKLRIGLRDRNALPNQPVKMEIKVKKPCVQDMALYVAFR